MSVPALRLFGSLAFLTAASLATLVCLRVDPPLQLVPVPASLFGAVAAACVLFAALSGEAPWHWRSRRGCAWPIGVKGAYLTATSAVEEVLWRRLVLGGLAPIVGLAPAFVASVVGFALAHGIRRRDVLAVHLLTGSAFGAVYVATGRVEAAILTHALYNWLVVGAMESARGQAPPPASVGTEPVAFLDEVDKRYGRVVALRAFTLAVHRGEVLALLGPNGAGKTTALAILLGLRRPDKGRARLFGQDPREVSARRHVGVAPQETGFPVTLKVREVVELVRAHYPRPATATDVLERFGLASLSGRQVGGLSVGQKRRLAVSLAFVGNPSAIVLDEPGAGLDLASRRQVWDEVRAFAHDGGTVLLTTHYLEEADALATRIVVVGAGTTVAEGSPGEVKARAGLKRIRLEADSLPAVAGVEHAARTGRVHTLYAPDPGFVIERLVERGVPLVGLEIGSMTLEEAFLSLTQPPA